MSRSATAPWLFYEDRGEGEPMLLFTGFSVSSAVFEPLADAYGQHSRCLTFDYRGSGRSARWSGVPSLAALGADGLRILDRSDCLVRISTASRWAGWSRRSSRFVFPTAYVGSSWPAPRRAARWRHGPASDGLRRSPGAWAAVGSPPASLAGSLAVLGQLRGTPAGARPRAAAVLSAASGAALGFRGSIPGERLARPCQATASHRGSDTDPAW